MPTKENLRAVLARPAVVSVYNVGTYLDVTLVICWLQS